ncbi:O-antigen ligase family protein [Candidatus Saccharibacteria bacterium]|nr:O-antigen ligase family protein [Candidatus Saccharibacteria bacterium]
MKKLYRYFLYVLPLVLFFSYFPVISLGGNETMNFELSLPLIWLALFFILSLVMVVKKYKKQLFTKVFGNILWWLFPLFATLSICWSLNPLRSFLTVGVMWLLFFAVIAFYELRENLDENFWKVFFRWFFSSALFVCAWCVVQCILDVNGANQSASLLCDGCVSQMFGFPHPNGFAIEPQFMGNLLIAPILVSVYFYIKNHNKKYLILFAIFAATLFLTFSRGAIYATVVGLVFLFSFAIARAKKSEAKKVFFTTLKTLGVFVISFLFTLNLQGIFAASSPTSDTYADGVAKVLNHLSLGVVDVRGSEQFEPVENSTKPVENSEAQEAIFDGYVAESTDTRVRLFKSAFEIWKKDFKTMAVGVGIGGAGQALYNNGFSPAPKEIVQNEYASLFLETGLVGVLLFIIIIVLAVKVALKNRKYAGLILSLMVAYAVTFLFFSGLPNALNIILIPGLLILLTL